MKLQLRRDTDANWIGKVLLPGEPGFATDTGILKIGDTIGTAWENLDGISGGGGEAVLTPMLTLTKDDVILEADATRASGLIAGFLMDEHEYPVKGYRIVITREKNGTKGLSGTLGAVQDEWDYIFLNESADYEVGQSLYDTSKWMDQYFGYESEYVPPPAVHPNDSNASYGSNNGSAYGAGGDLIGAGCGFGYWDSSPNTDYAITFCKSEVVIDITIENGEFKADCVFHWYDQSRKETTDPWSDFWLRNTANFKYYTRAEVPYLRKFIWFVDVTNGGTTYATPSEWNTFDITVYGKE